MFCTYAHYTPEGELFYVGKGNGVRRANRFVGRNNRWNKKVAKYGNPKVEVLAHWADETEAFEHEKFLIACFRDLGFDLCNLTDGGEGSSGLKLSEEHKRKIGLKLKGRTGQTRSEETLQKLRQSHLGQPAWNKGLKNAYTHPAESVAKRAAKMQGHTHNAKFRYIGISKDGLHRVEFVGNPAIKNAGFDPARVRNCAKGMRKTHKNYIWSQEVLEKK